MTNPLIDKYLKLAAELQASDLHLIKGVPPTFRVNGEIILADEDALSGHHLEQVYRELTNPDQQLRFDRDWELCISLWHAAIGRTRITVYRRNGFPEYSFRFCGEHIPSREELGLPKKIDDLARRPNGLILVTGPTGAGKTTTLNYMINLMNQERRSKIITIEDPIEFVHQNNRAIVIQHEVLTDVKNYHSALIHVLRQDPDVIVVGEMRDHETISTALSAAETGHLVLATLHSPNAVHAFERILGVFEGNAQRQVILQLANTLQGIIVQELLPSANRLKRILTYELVIGNGAVRRLIRDNLLHQVENVIQTSKKEGMVLFDNCLFERYSKCEITYDTAISHARDPENFERRLQAQTPDSE